MLTSRVFAGCVIGFLLAACGESEKPPGPPQQAAGTSGAGASGGKGGAGGGAGTSSGASGGSAAGGTGGGATGGKSGAGGAGGGGTSSGGTGGSAGGDAGDAGEAGDGNGGGNVGGSAGVSGASGAGGEGGTGVLGEDVEGIYTLDDVIRNTGSCDPGGTSVRSGYPATHVVVRRTTIGGTTPALVVSGCSGLAACRTLGATLVDDATSFELPPYNVFMTEEPGGTFTNTVTYFGSLDGTTCRDGGVDLVSLSIIGTALLLDTRVQRTDYPAVNGTCPPGVAREQGEMAPCTQRSVLSGTRVETF